MAAHRAMHGRLLADLRRHVRVIERGGAAGDELFNFLKLWVLGHIRGVDPRYAAFMREA